MSSSSRSSPPKGDPMILHRIIRTISGFAAKSFFSEVRVIAGENVPEHGPIIVAATHHNMMLDPVILSIGFPYQRMLNYWSKASLFASPIMARILYSTGNIPVDRKSKDRQKLFEGTIQALAQGNAVALFPEGTSYTEPRIMQVKDGAAWAALEYTKYARENNVKQAPVVIVPAAIVYTNKSKYRSSVIMEFGKPISMDDYTEEFFSPAEGAARAAVKRLTRTIETSLTERTINAPDWDTLYSARMARDILWSNDKSPVPLDDFVAVSQTLVDVFSSQNAGLTRNFSATKRALLRYYSLLQSTHLSHSTLSSLPLPRTLDPSSTVTLPSRLYTLLILIRDTTMALINLPFFFLPLLLHLPVYFFSRFGAHLVQDEEETQAQNKVFFGLFSLLFVYPAIFTLLWSLFLFAPPGIFVGLAGVYLLWMHHTRMVDQYYRRFKGVIAAWRVLVGVWAPKRWEFAVGVVEEVYGKPRIPNSAPNPFLNTPKNEEQNGTNNTTTTGGAPPAILRTPHLSTATEPQPTYPTSPPSSESSLASPSLGKEVKASLDKKAKHNPHRRPPSRRIMRHVLRARVEAVRALASFFEELSTSSFGTAEGPTPQIKSSVHLSSEIVKPLQLKFEDGEAAAVEYGVRQAKDVIDFLKRRGAVIPSLSSVSRSKIRDEGAEGDATDWGVLTGDEEVDSSN